MRKNYLLSEWLVSNKSQQLSLTYISENQSKNVWKLKRVLIGKKLQGYLCEMSGKRYCCTRKKKVVSLQLHKRMSPFPLIKNQISILCIWKYDSLLLHFSFLSFFWLVGIIFFFNGAAAKLIVSCFVGYVKVYFALNSYWRLWQCVWVQITVHLKPELQNSEKSVILWG